MAKGKRRKYPIKAADLLAAGYIYKLDHLSQQESDEWRHGVKKIINGREVRVDSQDYDYFYKSLHVPGESENCIVKIHHVNKDFYFEGVKLRNKSQFADVEKIALERFKYRKLDAQVKDTKPIDIQMHLASTNSDGTHNFRCTEPVPTAKMPHIITLKGGPLDGYQFAWNITLPFFMTQYQETDFDSTGKPIGYSTTAVRYRRDKENKTLYHHDPTFAI